MTEGRSKTDRSIVALGGEGIGPEVVDATCELLAGTGMPVSIVTPPHGAAAIATHGTPVPEETRRACEAADSPIRKAGRTSSRSTARHRTSPGAGSRTRPARSSRLR